MSLLHRNLLALALLGALPLAACDTGTPEGPALDSTVDLTMRSVSAQGTCDPTGTRSEYQVRVSVRDRTGSEIAGVTLPEGTTYGVWPGEDIRDYIQLGDGESAELNRVLSFHRPLAASAGFSVLVSVTEWDGSERDANMNDVVTVMDHPYRSGGSFEGAPAEGVEVRASPGCSVRLRYFIRVR